MVGHIGGPMTFHFIGNNEFEVNLCNNKWHLINDDAEAWKIKKNENFEGLDY